MITSTKSVLICDHVHDVLLKGLEASSFNVDYKSAIESKEMTQILEKYHGVVINTKTPMFARQLMKATNLEFIARLGSGLDIIDLDIAKEQGVKVISAPEGNCNAVAEHALGMLLSLTNKIHTANAQIAQSLWNREANRGQELAGKSIGIIGFGHTGPAFSRKLMGFDMNILVYDKYRPDWGDAFPWVQRCSIEQIQAQADIISIHLPLSKETNHFVNTEFIDSVKKPFILINTARGKNVNTSALLEGIRQGQISGACLDVLENEKIATWKHDEREIYQALIDTGRVLMTPHVAGWTVESKRKIAQTLLDKINSHYRTIAE